VPADKLPPLPLLFRQSPTNPDQCFLVDPEGNTTKVAPADVVGYEREAAWAAVHVESRLNDLYAGRASPAVEALRPHLGQAR
jgi:hypothetical protein